jgi:heat shock protein HslJ
MKSLLTLMFAATLLISCNETDIVSYEYHSTTMMGKTKVIITQDSVVTSFNGRGEPTRTARATQSSEWTALAASLKEVDLSKISTLESPTNKRATDAAPFGSIIITTKDSTYTSAGFDGKNPHDMLKPLMEEIVKVWEKN